MEQIPEKYSHGENKRGRNVHSRSVVPFSPFPLKNHNEEQKGSTDQLLCISLTAQREGIDKRERANQRQLKWLQMALLQFGVKFFPM